MNAPNEERIIEALKDWVDGIQEYPSGGSVRNNLRILGFYNLTHAEQTRLLNKAKKSKNISK